MALVHEQTFMHMSHVHTHFLTHIYMLINTRTCVYAHTLAHACTYTLPHDRHLINVDAFSGH